MAQPTLDKAYYLEAQAARKLGHDDLARQVLQAGLAVNPRSGLLAMSLADLEQSLHNWKAAEQTQRQALTLEPDNPAILRELATAIVRGEGGEERIEEAITLLQRAIQLDPTDADARGRLGFLYLEIGELENALVMTQDAVAIDSTDPYLQYYHALALWAQGQFAEASAALDRAIALAPTNVTYQTTRRELADAIERRQGGSGQAS